MLDEEVSALAEDVHLRLAAARRAAVAEMDRPHPFFNIQWLTTSLVATSLAAILMLAVGIWPVSTTIPEIPVYSGEDAQLAAQNIDLLSDMEFVAWLVLEEEPNAD